MLSGICSQWRLMSASLVWSERRRWKISRVAAFRTDCNLRFKYAVAVVQSQVHQSQQSDHQWSECSRWHRPANLTYWINSSGKKINTMITTTQRNTKRHKSFYVTVTRQCIHNVILLAMSLCENSACRTWKRRISRGFPAFLRQFWLHFMKNFRKNL